MKLITAVIKPFKLEDVRRAVGDAGVQGITVTEVRGFTGSGGHGRTQRGDEYGVEFVPNAKIEIAVPDALLERALAAIARAAESGKAGDGEIFVFDLSQVARIRTGERDDAAC